jgi:hypothetical protein
MGHSFFKSSLVKASSPHFQVNPTDRVIIPKKNQGKNRQPSSGINHHTKEGEAPASP